MFRTSNFDKSLESATSNLNLEPDWQSIMVICDAIRQGDVTAKHAIQQLKKKMFSTNPHSALYALLVLESVVKNCGSPIHDEISNKANCEMFQNLVNNTQHEEVRAKMLELIQAWACAFRSVFKYRSIRDTMNILKSEGHKFPELKEADAMFTSEIAPDWADGEVCHRCRVQFSFTQRKHHCRNCGQVFCHQCSSKTSTLPKFGIEKDVRVCEGCFAQLQRPTPTLTKKPTEEEDLPAEYLSSSLAQQTQAPARKTEEELREEEELQLALALSQSEAETKKSKQTRGSFYKSSSPEPAKVQRSPSPVEEPPTDPELARYLNRNYWEQRQAADSPASPSAPSPMPSPMPMSIQHNLLLTKGGGDDAEINEFAHAMKTQVEIFVNRMKSNSSRGRSISTDSSVQTLFMNLTSLHSRLLTFIKDMDDKRMWYEQLQDKLTQIKDSRAALDVLRQEHQEKLRRIAEEQERQKQLQMAQKLEIMRKKKQEYLQYQRQLALQRIQEQEREMQIRQEQQKAQYRMGTAFPFMSPPIQGQPQGSPVHGGVTNYPGYMYQQIPAGGTLPHYGPPGSQPGVPPQIGPQLFSPQHGPPTNMSGQYMPQIQPGAENVTNPPQQQNLGQPTPQQLGSAPSSGPMMPPPGLNMMPGQGPPPGPVPMANAPMMAPPPPQQGHPMSAGPVPPPPGAPIPSQDQPQSGGPQSHIPTTQQPAPASAPPQTASAPAPSPAIPSAPEPPTAELISFD
ncbi:hepatocyte growth factor-regulated tyrosine kinase substrate [Toxorhynchites rutilus septentrionalis]|uniref:hepatocyte growth factor-regulated tyrosine kinase substrate n=1 Tax=Toxorhynchites rutilus septentrionalis TaxID=329112 RepID=UPI002479564D|nr:hepatocyte growth factor-regulated tyrosine kinase substrate [Toxorhynchites rutilus septentrionalis]